MKTLKDLSPAQLFEQLVHRNGKARTHNELDIHKYNKILNSTNKKYKNLNINLNRENSSTYYNIK